MKIETARIRRRFKASFLCIMILTVLCSVMAPGASAAVKGPKKSSKSKTAPAYKGTFDKPDFAFPKNVESDARKLFDEAMKTGDGLTALRAAIQLDVAADVVSTGSYPASLARFDSIAVSFGAPWSQLARVLEAKLYRDIYDSDSWTFNTRQLPMSDIPESALEWSTPMFGSKIASLLKEVYDARDELVKIPITRIAPLLVRSGDAESAEFSVYDFVALQALSLSIGSGTDGGSMPTIPFRALDESPRVETSASAPVPSLFLNYATEMASREGNKYKEAYFCGVKLSDLRGDERKEYLEECIGKFTDTLYCSQFITEFCSALPSDNDGRRNGMRMLDDYISRYPDAVGIEAVRNMAESLRRRNVEVRVQSQVLPDVPVRIVVSGANLYDFWVLAVPLSDKVDLNRCTNSDLRSSRVAASLRVQARGTVPDAFADTIAFPALPPGNYALVPSSTPTLAGLLRKDSGSSVRCVNVSGLSYFSVQGGGESSLIYVVSGANQAPAEGAKVTFYSPSGNTRKVKGSGVTDASGMVAAPQGFSEFEIRHQGNALSGSIYSYPESENIPEKTLRGDVLTDLSIYHPGGEVGFSAILYTQEDKVLAPAPDKSFRAILRDANSMPVDTLQLVTDRFGRADSRFTLPADGLLGSWGIFIDNDDLIIGACSFEVSEYKAPSFFGVLRGSEDTVEAGKNIEFKGEVRTYSGMPVADATVKYTIRNVPAWWRSSIPSASYGGEVRTDADGSFAILLSTEELKGTPYEKCSFRLEASVTDQAGETQNIPGIRFGLGHGLFIQADLPAKDEAGKDKSYSVTVRNMTGEPVKKTLYYRVSREDETVAEGEFESPAFRFDTSRLPSGRYAVIFSLTPDFKDTPDCSVVTDSVTIWRKSDVLPPVPSILWMPEKRIVAGQGADKVTVRFGTSLMNRYVFALVSDSRSVISRQWVKVSSGFASLDVPAPSENGRIFVTLMAMDSLQSRTADVEITPYSSTRKIRIETVTFRDRITPGDKEEWRFRFSLDGEPLSDLPALAVMSDKSLNALADFKWYFNPRESLYWGRAGRIDKNYLHDVLNYYNSPLKYLSAGKSFVLPAWNLYGYQLYGGGVRNIRTRGMSRMKSVALSSEITNEMKLADARDEEAQEDEAVVTEAFYMESAKAASGEAPEAAVEMEEAGAEPTITLRETETPLAFFMPSLVTDSKGETLISFTATDFTGTWQFQLLGYDREMSAAVLTLDAVSAKPVMAKMNAPRFVRTGDRMSLSANLFNNTDGPAPLEGRIEILDALTGKIMVSKQFDPVEVAASGSRLISVSYDVPQEIEALTLRVIGEAAGSSDGEQTLVAVLPATTVVRESEPFYLSPSQGEWSLRLPRFRKDASLTLSYCGNPVWECVTALPALVTPESENVLAQASALFGNAVASGLFRKYPQLAEGINLMASEECRNDSSLYSPLMRDEGLKAVLLNNTPWVNDALAESLRMQSLVKYADADASEAAISAIVRKLQERQGSDGGWSWCTGMKTSSYITMRVLGVFGTLRSLGFLPGGTEKMAEKGFRYIDSALADEWKRNDRKRYSTATMIDYLYARGAFSISQTDRDFAKLESVALKDMESDWRKLEIREKATVAIIMYRKGRTSTAALILESLRQYASEDPAKGMWFDNLKSVWNSAGPLLTTSRVLEAFSLIRPEDPAIDAMRRCLAYCKQTQSWSGSREAASAVAAILTSGTDWTAAAGTPSVTLDGQPLEVSSVAAMTGAFTVNIPEKDASGKTLLIKREEGLPAWGGVMATYVAPLSETLAVSVPQLSIAKSLNVITSGEMGVSATTGKYSVGDLVRVTLTIVCDRDLDYLTVVDERAACLEPVDQTSSYTSSDGVWYYREVRDTKTSLFIPFLSKGTHVITYDCHADRAGEYSVGIATAQSQYAPLIVASTKASTLRVVE